ncbi:hypothetical protein [Streptomyces hainanensis]|uniref:Uncharacterized protein n=1 Tax=Streptomyces hainanensis TaxID=402648 RepID=A0A4R4TKM4_9ACTN|nr:hypothetical protein [Streptomyces hainanensis]TDC78367.1 hypothetical protein E1283_05205 [Streptomyces hainanensis]
MTFPEYVLDPNSDLDVQFLDYLRPTLPAGSYELTASQKLTDGKSTLVDGGEYLPTEQQPVRQTIEVRAPRFGIEPEWLHGCYPPDGSTGLYSDVLPHVTLNRPTLPWEREPAKAPPAGEGRPWLALLLFGEGELRNDPHCLGQTDERTVRQLAEKSSRLDEDRNVTLPSFDTVGSPVPDEDRNRVCRTILLTRATFRALAPTEQELPFLAHVRLVDERQQKVLRTLDEVAIGDYAVVTANRIPPAAGGRFVAHLVSLEGWTLPQEKDQSTGGDERLRMISLWSSAFESLPDHSPGFAALTEQFVRQGGTTGEGLLLRLPSNGLPTVGDEQGEVEQRLADGYVPVSCRTEAGSSTFAWYRGPFTPAVPPAPPERERRRCAAEGLIHLPAFGIFDISLPAAFTIGRGVALADRGFCTALLRLRGTLAQRALLPAPPPGLVRATPKARPGGEAGERLESLIGSGMFDRLEAGLRSTGNDWQKTSGDDPTQEVTRFPTAPGLPALTDVTARDARDKPAERKRVSDALAPLTGVGAFGKGAVRPAEDLAVVRRWLGELITLNRVPFAQLVPDSAMLPVESLRFFHVDPEWIETLLEGALSVGLAREFDLTVDEVLWGIGGDGALPRPKKPCGLVIRSQLASGWPALEVRPYAEAKVTAGEKPLPLIRREHLADDVLLVLFDGVPGRVELREPQQGIHFGIDEPATSQETDPIKGGVIRLRDLGAGQLGQEKKDAKGDAVTFPSHPGLGDYVRKDAAQASTGVLRVAQLAQALGTALGKDTALRTSEFAIQLINAAQRRTFRQTP